MSNFESRFKFEHVYLGTLKQRHRQTRTAANAHNYLRIPCQECALQCVTASLLFRGARGRVRARSIWTAAQRLWLSPRLRRSARPEHTRHPAVSSNLLRLSLFLRHTLMSAINYTSTFWGVVVFADSLFPLPFQHSKL